MKADEKILKEAQQRFRRVSEWESHARKLALDDLKFGNADADNGWQWPDTLRKARDVDERPCLTINKVRQHCLQIINDARQNKPAVKIRAVGGDASAQSAKIYDGVVRHIEYISNAQAAYDTATTFQVYTGIGYWRVVTDYAGDDTFDQEIFIRRVKDPRAVYLDPDIAELDGSDARFGFVFDDLTKDEFEAKYPQYKDACCNTTLNNKSDWLDSEKVRVAEYYRRVERSEKLYLLPNGETVLESDIPREAMAALKADASVRSREITRQVIEWYLICGETIVERRDWPGKYIPLVRVVGEETIVEGRLDRKGHVRALKDPQRMYNYWTSSAVEFVALQGKMPYVAPVAAIEGVETYWETSNRINHAVLPYNHVDEQGNSIPAPERQQPPVMATAYMQGMEVASHEMMMVSGQYQAEMGAPSNEKSGVAILQRQRQGDNATYHFVDNLALAIRYTGKILIDLIPKVYDTPRIIRILAEDGTEEMVQVDPSARAALQEQVDERGRVVSRIFNPAVGKYEVEADIGPAFATRRQEAFNAFMQIAGQSPEIMQVAGDLMFKAADFPMADELAERLKRTIPPAVLGDAPPPEMQQMQAQVQQLQAMLEQAVQAVAQAKQEAASKAAETEIRAYDAETKRMQVLGPAIAPEQIAQLAAQMVMEALNSGLPTGGTAPQAAGTA